MIIFIPGSNELKLNHEKVWIRRQIHLIDSQSTQSICRHFLQWSGIKLIQDNLIHISKFLTALAALYIPFSPTHWVIHDFAIQKSAHIQLDNLQLAYTSKTGQTGHTSYLSFFLHGQNFWRIKFTPKFTQ